VASASISLLINTDDDERKGRLIAFDSSGKYTSGQTMIRHEAPTVGLRCVQPSTTTSRLWDDLSLEAARSSGGVRLALGEFDKPPASGDWPLAYGGSGSGLTALAYNITAAALLAALNAHAGITAAGGIASVVQAGRSYRLTFSTVGAKADFTSADNTLLPLSSVTITRARVGDADTKEIVVITVKRRPYALCDTWTAAPTASVDVETAIVGDDSPATNCVQVITLTPGTYSGTYSIAAVWPDVVTGPGSGTTTANIVLAATDTAAQVLAKLQQHPEAVNDDGTSNLVVTGNVGGPFTVEFVNELKQRAIAEMVATNINLLAPGTITGVLNLNQDMIAAAFDAASDSSTTISLIAELEIEEPGDEPFKPYQDTWTIRRDVLDNAGSLPAPSTSYAAPGLLVQFRRDITTFAGLGAIVTATGKVQCVVVNIAGEPRMWGLVSGTDATDTAAGIKRPDDFDATTNPYVWKSIL
jgi:hypothetical protein